MCCAGHVFPDTGLRTRNLSCLDEQRWSEINVPGCIGKFKSFFSVWGLGNFVIFYIFQFFFTDVHHIMKSGNQSLIDILRQAHKNGLPDGVELGELFQGYDLTYGECALTDVLMTAYLERERSGSPLLCHFYLAENPLTTTRPESINRF